MPDLRAALAASPRCPAGNVWQWIFGAESNIRTGCNVFFNKKVRRNGFLARFLHKVPAERKQSRSFAKSPTIGRTDCALVTFSVTQRCSVQETLRALRRRITME
jgi:hypothetical protein